jgi:hypothetical protein
MIQSKKNIQATKARKDLYIINIEILKIMYVEELAFIDRDGDIYINHFLKLVIHWWWFMCIAFLFWSSFCCLHWMSNIILVYPLVLIFNSFLSYLLIYIWKERVFGSMKNRSVPRVRFSIKHLLVEVKLFYQFNQRNISVLVIVSVIRYTSLW